MPGFKCPISPMDCLKVTNLSSKGEAGFRRRTLCSPASRHQAEPVLGTGWRSSMCSRMSSIGGTVAYRPAPGRGRAVQVGILPFLLLVATALAQQETKDLTEASLEDLANIQVYSASKHMQSVSEAPSSVTVITADEIQKYGYRTLADVLRGVGGFYITYDRDYSYL